MISSPHILSAAGSTCAGDDVLNTFPATVSLADVNSMTEPYVPMPNTLPVGVAFLVCCFNRLIRALCRLAGGEGT